MRYVVWVLRLLVFVLVLLFALRNTGPVDVNFYADYVVSNVPLIVVMLVAFVIGALFGVLVVLPAGLRRRREVARLRRELEQAQQAGAASATERSVAPDMVAPLAPM